MPKDAMFVQLESQISLWSVTLKLQEFWLLFPPERSCIVVHINVHIILYIVLYVLTGIFNLTQVEWLGFFHPQVLMHAFDILWKSFHQTHFNTRMNCY